LLETLTFFSFKQLLRHSLVPV